MAEINIEKKKPVWPWVVAGILALLLILFLMGVFDGDDDMDAPAETPTAMAPVDDSVTPAEEPALNAGMSPADLERMVGAFSSDTMQLMLESDGSYTLQESPAGEARGSWTYEPGTNSVQLSPADASQPRHFRVEGDDTLVPLDANGQPAAMMSQLTRQDGAET